MKNKFVTVFCLHIEQLKGTEFGLKLNMISDNLKKKSEMCHVQESALFTATRWNKKVQWVIGILTSSYHFQNT